MIHKKLRVLVTTPLPTPYQVELFNALTENANVHLTVLYEKLHHHSRSWNLPQLRHEYRNLDNISAKDANELLDDFDLVVFSGYQVRDLRHMIKARAASGRPWCFWGERPGFRVPQWIGRHYRARMIPDLRRRAAPIWGIGEWAVSGYRKEFGQTRLIVNVPYFSRLDHFLSIGRKPSEDPPQRILFSGSLIKRKGVDLLVRAFLTIADEHPALELHLIGDGPLKDQLRRMSSAKAARVHFHGFKQWSELNHFYSEADILCAPSRYDGWGMIVPEGLAAGLLVISTDRTGAARELIAPDVGWVIQANRLEPLVAALLAAVSTTSAERAARVARGREVAATQDVSAAISRFLKAIDDTIAAFDTIPPYGSASMQLGTENQVF